MIRLFRKIRHQLLSQDKYPIYLLYAAGEILLVVVGILLALQIDNWNEERKLRSMETTVLIDLKNEIFTNINGLERAITNRENVLNAARIIFDQSGPQATWNLDMDFDSLLFSVVVSGWKYFPESGVVTDILSTGKLSVIKNDRLRYLISSLPADMKRINDEDDTYRVDLHGYFLPYFSANYRIKNIIEDREFFGRDMSSGPSVFTSSPESILRDPELEGVLTIQNIWTNTALGMYVMQLDKYKSIVKLIEQELK